MKGAIDVQDDYNRFIRRSIKQAQCNYEDIFSDYDDAENHSYGCSVIMDDVDEKKSCGCGKTMGDMEKPCCKTKNPCGYGNIAGQQNCHNEQADMCKPACGCDTVPVMVFIEMQPFGRMYNEAEGLCRGTLFPALDKPFTGRGGKCGCTR